MARSDHLPSHGKGPSGASTIRILWLNGVFNLLGAALILLMSNRVGSILGVGHEASFLWNIIAACSFAFGLHSFLAAASKDAAVIRVAVLTMLGFHVSTALTAALALLGGIRPFVTINLALHIGFAALFAWASLRSTKTG